MKEMKQLPKEAHALVVAGDADECWQNDLYEVLVRRDIKPGDKYGPSDKVSEFPEITWLSIKLLEKHGKGEARNWRHFQEIKNDICGVESEGVELFPAESRKVDSSNQYHMWVLNDPYGWPFGMAERLVMGSGCMLNLIKNFGLGVQKPFDPDDRYCEEPEEEELWATLNEDCPVKGEFKDESEE